MLAAFVTIAESRDDAARADRWRAHMQSLRDALEEHGWDGDWYRRAYFDDGTPLGSASNAECRIDSIAQSWSILSGAADRSRAERAMAAVDEYLIRRGDGLVLLFTPPFDHGDLDPGYIKGYLPGIRENGGQYTHAAIWSVLAFAALGDGNKAGELFSILNPVNHASTTAGVHRYKVEPYVMAADIYAEPPHTGSRRLDLVHRRRRMDVPGRHRVDPGLPSPRHRAQHRAVHPHDLARLRDPIPLSHGHLRDRRREPARREHVESPRSSSMGNCSQMPPPSRFGMTARHTGCEWCSAPPLPR